MSLSPAFLDELRARTLLSALVGKSMKLTRAGREFKGCCPFHDEKTPSFYVNDAKGFYHCFGCGAHGDAIRWMTDQLGLGFIDAVKELAQAAGVEMPAPDPRAQERAAKAETLHDVTEAAARFFANELAGANGAAARAYVKRRTLTDKTVAGFAMGFAPDSRNRLRQALEPQFGLDKLVEAGLVIRPDEKGKEPYDRFRGRLMIPIRDPRGRVIAFGGRILDSGEPKYLNSPDTPLFDKGRTLFNLDRAAGPARKANRIVVVEGYMDVIALAQAGIEEAVAPLGTALTEMQLERLWRTHEAPILCFDGDGAGQRAAIRAIGRALPMLAPDRTLRFVTLPAGQDPDDLIRSGGKAAIDALLAEPEPLVERLWRHERDAEPLTTPEARASLSRRLNEQAQAIGDPELRREYQAEFRRRCEGLFTDRRLPRRGPRQSGPRDRRGWMPVERPVSAQAHAIRSGGIDERLLRAVFAGLLRHPAWIAEHSERIADLRLVQRPLDRLRAALLDAALDDEALEATGLAPILAAAGLDGLAREIGQMNGLAFSFLRDDADPERAHRDLGEAIDVLVARPEIDAALAQASARLGERMDEAAFAEQQRLRAALRDTERRLMDLVQADGATV
ncbi:MAG: DNA primase [Sphingomonadaceae bacterium]|nr:DNA primase [Sphingomonadaceae bacterium]